MNTGDLSRKLGFSIEHLRQILEDFPKLVEVRSKRKRNSEDRRLYLAPQPGLLKIQRSIKHELLSKYPLSANVRGLGGLNKSHISTAQEHSSNHEVVSLDIVNFYDSVSAWKVFDIFSKMGYNDESAKLLTGLTTFRGRLWQGLATSSHLALICTAAFTEKLSSYASKQGMVFSQYHDDLFFSAGKLDPPRVVGYVVAEAKKHNLSVKRQKIAVDKSGIRKITGTLSTASGTRAPKNLRKRAELLARIYTTNKNPAVEQQLRGLLSFISDCRPSDGKKIVRKYKIKF